MHRTPFCRLPWRQATAHASSIGAHLLPLEAFQKTRSRNRAHIRETYRLRTPPPLVPFGDREKLQSLAWSTGRLSLNRLSCRTRDLKGCTRSGSPFQINPSAMASPDVGDLDGCAVTHSMIDSQVGGGKLHLAQCGSETGPLILFLHGFPSFWICWRQQLTFFASKGFCAAALDLRGYNSSLKPEDVASYSRDAVVSDIAAAVTHLTGRKDEGEAADDSKNKDVTLVGHDWGGVAAYEFAHDHPALLDRLVVINAPHSNSFKKHMTWSQMQKSYYIGLFQVPYLGQYFISRDNFKPLKFVIGKMPKMPPPKEDVDRHVQVFSQPNGLTGPINYYMAIFWGYWAPKNRKNATIDKPCLVLWGDQDPHLDTVLADPPKRVTQSVVKHYPEGTHWLLWDEAEAVNNDILEFTQKSKL